MVPFRCNSRPRAEEVVQQSRAGRMPSNNRVVEGCPNRHLRRVWPELQTLFRMKLLSRVRFRPRTCVSL